MQRLWEVRDLPKPFELCGRHTLVPEEMLNCYTIGEVIYPPGGLMPALILEIGPQAHKVLGAWVIPVLGGL
jgi:hypothetical protein